LKCVKTAAVAIAPARLERVTTDHFPTRELETRRRIANRHSRNVPHHIGLSTARGTWAGLPQEPKWKKRLLAITPLDGELIPDYLKVFRLKAHMPTTLLS
jgi:hypothetical protein